MKDWVFLGLGLSFGFIGFIGTVANAEPIRFGYGCGTGCSINVQMTSGIETVRAANGRVWNRASYSFEMRGGGRGNQNFSGRSYAFADCSRRQLVRSDSKIPPLAIKHSWEQLSGDNSDYITVSAGRGIFFNALCATKK